MTTQCPEDIEAWIELGGILQNSDVNEALNAYNTAAQIIRDNIHEDVPPEILNNIASCLFQLGKYEVTFDSSDNRNQVIEQNLIRYQIQIDRYWLFYDHSFLKS